jgi:hypothetical protein
VVNYKTCLQLHEVSDELVNAIIQFSNPGVGNELLGAVA